MARPVDEESTEPVPKKRSFFKRIPILKVMLALNVLGIVAGLYLVYDVTIGEDRRVVTEKDAFEEVRKSEIFGDKPIVYSLDPFTVNLADEDERIVQIEVTLEMIDEDGFEEVVTMGGQARDTIVHILNGKSYGDIESIQGKLYLKDEITLALNAQLERSFIKDIYFSRFVIQ